jgi:hypothetical protein
MCSHLLSINVVPRWLLCWFCSLSLSVWAAESAAESWRAKGFQVSEKNGAITTLRGSCANFTEADFRALASISTLTTLQLGGDTLTDDNLVILGNLVLIEQLAFDASSFSDEGYRHFKAFVNLKRLALYHPSRKRKEYTGSGLAHLKELPKFEALTFAGAIAGDEALKAISQITQLKQFQAWHNTETAEGLKHLIALPNLHLLKLGQRLGKTEPSLCDKSLASLAQIQSLEKLILMEARLSYDALVGLSALPKLKNLEVSIVDTPAADVERLKKQLSQVNITWKPLTEDDQTMLTKKLHLK